MSNDNIEANSQLKSIVKTIMENATKDILTEIDLLVNDDKPPQG